MDLLARRNEIAGQVKKAVNTRGSGCHPGDLGAEMYDDAPLVERPIVLQDNNRVHVLALDMPPIKAGLQAFLDKQDRAKTKAAENSWDEPDLLHHGLRYQAECVRQARAALAADELNLPTQEWNCLNHILGYVGVHVVSATAQVQSYDNV